MLWGQNMKDCTVANLNAFYFVHKTDPAWLLRKHTSKLLRDFKIKTTSGLKCSYLCGNQYLSRQKFSLTISSILPEFQNYVLDWEGSPEFKSSLCPAQNRSKLIKLFGSMPSQFCTCPKMKTTQHFWTFCISIWPSSWDFPPPNIYLESSTLEQLAPISSHPITVCPQEDSSSVILSSATCGQQHGLPFSVSSPSWTNPAFSAFSHMACAPCPLSALWSLLGSVQYININLVL